MLASVRDAVMGAEKQPEIAIRHAESVTSGSPAAQTGAAKPVVTAVQSAVALPARPVPAEPVSGLLREPADKVRPKRGVSVHLSGSLRQLVPRSATAQSGTVRLLKRIGWVALVIAFICLILWALAPRGFLFGQEPPAEWDFQQPKPALASRGTSAAGRRGRRRTAARRYQFPAGDLRPGNSKHSSYGPREAQRRSACTTCPPDSQRRNRRCTATNETASPAFTGSGQVVALGSAPPPRRPEQPGHPVRVLSFRYLSPELRSFVHRASPARCMDPSLRPPCSFRWCRR